MKNKEFQLKQVAEIIAKSMYKSVKKGLKSPIKDVLDADFIAEAPSASVPVAKPATLYKKDIAKTSCLESEQLDSKLVDLKKPSKNNKLKQFLDKKKVKNNL